MADWGKILSRGDVEDRRGASMLALGGGGLGIVGFIFVAALNLFGGTQGGNVTDILNQLQSSQVLQQQVNPADFQQDDYQKFASTVLGSNNDLWRGVFQQNKQTYAEPKLVLFRNLTRSGCGFASSDVGPHYCPADQTIYLDETFFDELRTRFKAKGGDVAEAYVIAHEVGHHVQNQLGIMEKVRESKAESIALELQADCFAGVWAKSVSDIGVIEPGEINEALDAAAAVGDDRIQKMVQGQVNPETWTHGSSEQRVEWFNRGFTSGSPAQCNTF